MEVANNIMLYGSKIWAETLEVKKRVNSLISVQRTAALRIASAYRTVFAPGVLVIAGTIPVDMLVAELTEIYKAKSVGRHKPGHFRENTNDNGTMKTEEGGRQNLSRK